MHGDRIIFVREFFPRREENIDFANFAGENWAASPLLLFNRISPASVCPFPVDKRIAVSILRCRENST
jgi:hypothetical protein